MNGIKGQQKGTADEKEKKWSLTLWLQMSLDVAAVYHNGVRKVLEANLGFKNYDTPKFAWDIFINDHKS